MLKLFRSRPVWSLAFALVLPGGLLAADTPEQAPLPTAQGAKYAWKTGSGLRFEYFIPKTYDPKQGCNLILILHGSNLDRRWGFANHTPGTFRPHDIVVCPDGTTPNGSGGFNFRPADKDLHLLNELHSHFRKTFNVLATYLYGHSNGAFFAYLYAGAYPALVQGVLAQAGGVWIGTKADKHGIGQAICVMHGTADPVVPFAMAGSSRKFYADAGYERVRLRALRDWNHWPDQKQAALQLSWCEGMSSDSPERVLAALEELAAAEAGRDPVAIYQVGLRLSTLRFGSEEIRARAVQAAEQSAQLAGRHVAEIQAKAGRAIRRPKLEKKAWIGHLRLFLQQFDGMPACDELRQQWMSVLKAQGEKAREANEEYLKYREEDPRKAFVAGVDLVAKGFLAEGYIQNDFLERLAAWREAAGELKISKTQTKYYDQVVPLYLEAMELGAQAFDSIR